jgi:hypothetical protein
MELVEWTLLSALRSACVSGFCVLAHSFQGLKISIFYQCEQSPFSQTPLPNYSLPISFRSFLDFMGAFRLNAVFCMTIDSVRVAGTGLEIHTGGRWSFGNTEASLQATNSSAKVGFEKPGAYFDFLPNNIPVDEKSIPQYRRWLHKADIVSGIPYHLMWLRRYGDRWTRFF